MSKPKIEPILSIIFDAIYETVCFQLTHFPFDDIKNICTSSYYLHQIGNTVESRYNTVHYNKILHSSLLKQRQNINQRPNPQNLPLYNGNPLYGSSAIV